jgi:hypothetical protein
MLNILALSDIAGRWEIGGVWSVFGVIYIIVGILIIAGGGGLKGGLTLINLALVGAFLVGVAGPGTNPDYLPDGSSGFELYVACKGGDYPGNGSYYWGPLVNTVRAEEHWRFSNKYNTFDRSSKYWEYDPDPKVYAMHVPGHRSYISPKIYHPAAWFWSPFIMCLIGLVGWFFCSSIQLSQSVCSNTWRVGSAEYYRNHPDNQ